MKTLTYLTAFNEKRKTKVTDADVRRIEEARASGEKSVLIGTQSVFLRGKLTLEDESVDAQTSNPGDWVPKLRESLIRAANGCIRCFGEGFVDVDGRTKQICECQAKVKERSGVDPNDQGWFHKDETQEESKFTRRN